MTSLSENMPVWEKPYLFCLFVPLLLVNMDPKSKMKSRACWGGP